MDSLVVQRVSRAGKIIAFVSALAMACAMQMITVCAEGEEDNYDFNPTGMQRYSSTGSTSTWSRKVSTAIGVYVKKGTVPQITKYDGTYNGVAYHVLEVDTANGNTQIQVDYAGNTPQYLNNFYDKGMTANHDYYWAGAINAGFFNASANSNMYGYPTGAVKKNGEWQTYTSSGTDNSPWECTPSYGAGFVTAYMNKTKNEFQLIYNGWKNGQLYRFAGDTNPTTWDYADSWNYTDGVSGAYTLMVDGDNSVHWGKDDYKGVNYWNYVGTAITLFGQKANGHYVLLTTSAGSLTADQCINLMTNLGCTNAIRFDGGGSSQMAYDRGLYIQSVSAPEMIEIDDESECQSIEVVVADGDGNKHYVPLSAVGNNINVEKNDDESYNVTADTVVGTVSIGAKIATYTVNFFDYDNNIIDTVTVRKGEGATPYVTPEKEGYTFTGWDTDTSSVAENMEVYPLFSCSDGYDLKEGACVVHEKEQEKFEKYYIRFDWNYGNSGSMDVYILNSGEELEIPENNFKKNGYVFTGWNTEMDGSGTSYEPGNPLPTGITDNMVLYAQWQQDTQYEVRFDWNYGNSGSMDIMHCFTNSENNILPENSFTKEGYTFTGWNTEMDGSGTSYEPGNPLPAGITNNMVLYAQWQQDNSFAQIQFD